MASERTVVVRIKAEYAAFKADMEAAGKAAENAAKKTEAAGTKASSVMGKLGQDAKNHEEHWNTAGNAMVGFGAGLVGVAAISVAKYAQFEKAMSGVGAATHESEVNMEALRTTAIRAGADTAYSAVEAAQGIEELAKAGVSTADILNGGLDGALSLAAAGQLSVADASEIAATQMVVFGLAGDKVSHVADLLSAGAGKAQGSVADLAMGLKYVGPVAAGMGVSIEETTGALAMFASNGILGEQAGTSLRGVMSSLTSPSKEARKEIDKLGITLYDSEGKFLGMSNAAGQLQGAYAGMDDAQRDASLGLVFGNAQVTAARILFKEGAEGIDEWTAAVSSAGYAALTAQIQNDNLLGDVEKLGGAFDTVFIKGGGGAAEALRIMVQNVEGVVDAIGKLDPEILSTAVSIAGIVGVSALAAGGLMKIVPAAISTFEAFRSLGTEGSKVPGALGKITKAATIAGAALVGIQILGQIFTNDHVESTTAYAEAIMKVSAAGEKAKSYDLDSIFQNWTTFAGADRVEDVNSMAAAVQKLANPTWGQELDRNLNFMNGWFNLPDSELVLLEERINGLGDSLGDLVSTGNPEAAAMTFRLMAEEFEKGGKSAQFALEQMPAYADSLRQVAVEAGATVSEADLLQWALTGVAPASVAAAQGLNAAKSELEGMGISADGAVQKLDKVLESLFEFGDGTLSLRAANRDFEESIDAVTDSIKKNGKTLDDTTPKGRANQAVLDGVASSGKNVAMTMATMVDQDGNLVHSQQDVQDSLTSTYQQLISTAGEFGITGQKAQDLAAHLLGVPDDVSIKTWIEDFATSQAEGITGAVGAIPTLKGVEVIVTDEGTVEVTKAQIQSMQDRTLSTTVTDDGTIMEVQGGINNIEGTTEHILVGDDGTVQIVQDKVNNITGKTEYVRVTDDGTITGVQGKINNVQDGAAQVQVTETGLSWIQSAINNVKDGYASIHIKSIYSESRGPALGPGGRGGPTKMNGGQLPRNAAGSRLPTTGPGTDTTDGILGMKMDGTPISWLDGGEWVINNKSSEKHSRLLSMINRDHPAIQRMTDLVGLQGLAKGGRIGAAEKRVKSTRRAYDLVDGKEKNRLRKLAARDQWEAAKEELADAKREAKASAAATKKSADERKKADKKKAAERKKAQEKAIAARKKAAEEEKARQGRLADTRFDVRADLRRGDIRESFTSGGGMSQVDKLFDMSRNPDYSKTKRQQLSNTARKLEKDLIQLEKRSDAVAKSLDKARDKRDELLQVKNQVAQSLRSEWNLGSVLEWDTLKNGPLTAKQINAAAKTKANQFKAFAGKIEALRKKGYAASIIQEVVDLGVNEGSYVADALLAANAGEVSELNKTYSRMDKFTNEAGTQVTNAMYKGGINAAEGLVRGLQSKERDVDIAFYNLGKTAENAYKRALGIKSPSTVMRVHGRHTAKGAELGILDGRPAVQKAMDELVSVSSDSVTVEHRAKTGAKMSGSSAGARVVQENHFHYPIAEATSKGVERANQLLTL